MFEEATPGLGVPVIFFITVVQAFILLLVFTYKLSDRSKPEKNQIHGHVNHS